jgi:hypothetical protein
MKTPVNHQNYPSRLHQHRLNEMTADAASRIFRYGFDA